MKTLLMTCLLILSLGSDIRADDLKDDLLRIHATLMPKIMMMDYDFKQRLVTDTISIAVIYDNEHQKMDAMPLQHYFKTKYPDGFQNHKIKLEFFSYKKIALAQKHTLYYLLPASKKNIEDALKVAYNQKALSFSYRDEDLKYGVMLSVKITNKVKPVINVDALKNTNVTLRPILMKIAEIYYQTSSIGMDFFGRYALYFV
jgi:hypothetical protein